jgi:hypothetical protein
MIQGSLWPSMPWMTRKDADDLRALADLFRERRRMSAIMADNDDRDPVGVHHGYSRRPCVAAVYRFPTGERLYREGESHR